MSSHMITAGGRDYFLDVRGWRTNEIDVADVAHSHAQVNRFNGHAVRPISVAEHTLLVADLAKEDGKSALFQLCCLMHDGQEAYTGDVSSPAKHEIGGAWHAFEGVHAKALRRQFGLITSFASWSALITHYDLVALSTERAALTAFDPERNEPWPVLDTPGREVPPASAWVTVLRSAERAAITWLDWKKAFLERFFSLQAEIQYERSVESHPL